MFMFILEKCHKAQLLNCKLSFAMWTITQNAVTTFEFVNPLSANPIKWSNTLKQFVGNLRTDCLSVFDHFVELALKGLTFDSKILKG